MPRLTPQGKIYSTDELMNLARIGSMGELSGACLSAFAYIKNLESEVNNLRAENANLRLPVKDLYKTLDPDTSLSTKVLDK